MPKTRQEQAWPIPAAFACVLHRIGLRTCAQAEKAFRNRPLLRQRIQTSSHWEPLLDRCEVIRFKDIEESRVQDIIAHYAETERDSLLYKGALELDHAALRNAVAALYSRGVHSIRQHQKLVDRAFCDAFSAYVFNESEHPESVVVGEALYAEAMASGEFVTAKKIGF